PPQAALALDDVVEARLLVAHSYALDNLFSNEALRLASAAQSQSVRIVQRLQSHRRGPHLAQDVDLEARALARERARHVAGGETPADAMAVGARGHVAD